MAVPSAGWEAPTTRSCRKDASRPPREWCAPCSSRAGRRRGAVNPRQRRAGRYLAGRPARRNPQLTYTMPPATTGPGPLIEAPLAATALTVGKSRLVSNSADHRTVRGGIRAQAAILRPREHEAGNDGDGPKQGRRASPPRSPQMHRPLRRQPDAGPGIDVYRVQFASRGHVAVRDREIDALPIRRRAELHAAERAPLAASYATSPRRAVPGRAPSRRPISVR